MSLANVSVLASQLDKHLIYPLLEFHKKRGADVAAAEKQILMKTAVFDSAIDLHAGDQEIVEELGKKKATFMGKVNKLLKAAQPILDSYFIKSDEGIYRLKLSASEMEEEKKQGKLITSELATLKINSAAIQALYELAFCLYDAGSYDQASDMLQFYLAIGSKKDDSLETSALWGKLVCDTGMAYWDAAIADINALRSALESSATTTVARSWLLHYSLFTYFKRINATQMFLEHVIDFSTYAYANTIEVASPHLIRYLAAAAILNRKKRSFLKRIMKIVEQEQYAYSDPITKFLVAVLECDFAEANKLMKTLSDEAEGDYFLQDHKDELLDAARMMVFDDYLKVHRVVSIPSVAEQLGMDVNRAELWLVNLIQESKIEAEIDSVSQKIRVLPIAASRTVHRDIISRLESIARPSN